jgi:hypothetical protein
LEVDYFSNNILSNKLFSQSQISGQSSIFMNEFISKMNKNELSSYASDFIKEKVFETKQFLDNFATGLDRPKFDILRGLRTNMKNVMTYIYEIHNDIMFLTEDIGINELFA